jgi:predicted ATPase
VRGERACSQDSKAAEALFLRSLERARQDGALSWELRTSTDLGRLWIEQGRRCKAPELLQSVLNRVTEGHSMPDFKDAAALRDALVDAIDGPPRQLAARNFATSPAVRCDGSEPNRRVT